MISSSSSSSSSSKDIALSTTSSSSSLSGSSPYHRLRHNEDVIIPIEEGCEDVKKPEVELRRMESNANDTFDIPWKNASLEKLRKWRQATLVLNATRRFRYTLDLKEEKKKEEMRRKIRAHAQVIRAAILFREAGERKPDGGLPRSYGIGREQLSSMTRDRSFSALQEYGGVKGLATLLKTNLEMGIGGDDAELVHRRSIFGANTYPRKKGRNFLAFVVDAFKDLTLMILIVAALASLALGIKTEGIKEGWYDGGSIAFAVILVVVVTAISDYKQSLQFQSLNEEKHKIRVEVKRSNRTIDTSIFDVVVGDVVCLKIGDQVPADGVLISGHSLSIDESSMTGESKIVHKNPNAPFFNIWVQGG